MMTATPYQMRGEVMSLAAVVNQAHKVLTAMIRGEQLAPHQINASVLSWLTERDLIEEMLGEDGDDFEYEVTLKGRNAVLGKRRNVVLN